MGIEANSGPQDLLSQTILSGTFVRGTSSGSATLYTVPASKICYVVSGFVMAIHDNTTSTELAELKLNDLSVLQAQPINPLASMFLTFAPTVPIKLTAGQTVKIATEGSGAITGRGGFTGYELSV